MIKAFKFLPAVLVFLLSCNPEKVDTRGVKKEMDKFKIKKITQGEIMAQSEKTGEEIYENLHVKAQNARLDSSIEKGSFENALMLCNYSAHPEKEELEKMYKASIMRIGLPGKSGKSGIATDSIQKMILDAYLFNQEKGANFFNDVQILEKEILYNRPLILDEESCLKCHGDKEKEIGSENYSLIISRFPDYKAMNFKKGELIGMFSLKLDKEELIRSIK